MDSSGILKRSFCLSCHKALLCEHFNSSMDLPRIELGPHPCEGCMFNRFTTGPMIEVVNVRALKSTRISLSYED